MVSFFLGTRGLRSPLFQAVLVVEFLGALVNLARKMLHRIFFRQNSN